MADSSSSSPHIPSSVTDAVATIAQLQVQLGEANKRITHMNTEGSQLIMALEAEKAKNRQPTAGSSSSTGVPNTRAATTQVKIPLPPQFKGEVGFAVDAWIRRLTKQIDFYGSSQFPDDESRIRFAVMYLEGAAMDWWDKIPAGEKSTMMVSWTRFVEALNSRFRPMQAAMLARARLSSIKQTGAVAAYVNLFLKELTPIDDMSVADQMFFFRAGLKSHIAQRVLEKMPKTLHEAMDVAILADAHTNKLTTPQYNYSSAHRNGGANHGGNNYSSASSRASASSSSSDMDISNVNHDGTIDEVRPPVFHEEDPTASSPTAGDITRELNRMRNELKKYQTQAAISAIGSSSASSSSSGSAQSGRVQVSKEEFDYCFANRLCLKCKKPNHRASECRGKYQPLK